jgi:hypothetical protein
MENLLRKLLKSPTSKIYSNLLLKLLWSGQIFTIILVCTCMFIILRGFFTHSQKQITMAENFQKRWEQRLEETESNIKKSNKIEKHNTK